MIKNKIPLSTIVGALLFVVITTGFSQSTSFNVSSDFNIGLGNYGEQYYSSIKIYCTGFSSPVYNWNVSGAWQFSTGTAGALKTSTNYVTIVPIPGNEKCGGGTLTVTGATTGGGGQTRVATTSSSSVIYTITLTKTPFNIKVETTTTTTGFLPDLRLSVVYPSSAVTYTWQEVSTGSPESFFHLNSTTGSSVTGRLYAVNTLSTALVKVSLSGMSSSCPSSFITQFKETAYVPDDGGGSVEPNECVDALFESSSIFSHCYTGVSGGHQTRVAYSVSPNPAPRELNVHFNQVKSVNDGPTTVSLYNQLGSLVLIKENVDTANSINWNTSDLPRGIYLLKVERNGTSRTERILIH